ncbi:hypothetical protein CDD80_6456 [Ophiocordyceps camponoti-rufipedis]|uniref:S-formylglutathione hydrolase n=1 Tax=Ophiocordyceps camponoti-rufipedis TaxID=2004952 RepID=A0A2C5YQP5_9HYPO|nr:hypothetical protein CDD80_6456 [Ophiocordyceps camponoti-rufipedis]
METYLVDELPRSLFDAYPQLDKDRVSIAGHSMGGHGALTLFLRHPGLYRSAFRGYLGENKERWTEHDATELLKNWKKATPLNCLIDVVCLLPFPVSLRSQLIRRQGTGDNFYKQGQLLPENFEKAVKEAGIQGVKVRYHDVSSPEPPPSSTYLPSKGYDHSYYFISTFAQDHVQHAAKALGLL